jgi:hypothetical protein
MDEMVDLSTGGDQEAINTFIAGKVRPCSFYMSQDINLYKPLL